MNSKISDQATIKNAVPASRLTAFRLVAVEGPQKGATFEIPTTGSRSLLGTSPVCSVQLVDPHVSRRHLALFAGDGKLELHDLGSSNGTFVNGVLVVECRCLGGELIRLGETVLRVDTVGQSQPIDEHPGTQFGRAFGASHAMRQVFAACAKLAQTRAPVVIEGETGTGKELLAECIHEAGPRREKPLVVFDPKSGDEDDLAAILFGAEPNAAGNTELRVGLFERAHEGTLLIDSPSEIPFELQRKLLRAVETGEVQRLGSDEVLRLNVRIIATSQVDLDRAVEEGALREDLFFRLCGARVEIPPLRSRREDVAPLVEHFWAAFGGHGTPPLAKFDGRPWPGNVRELQNAVANYLATGQHSTQSRTVTDDSDEGVVAGFEWVFAEDLAFPQAKQRVARAFERAYISRILARYGGSVTRAAAASGIARRYFQLLHAKHRK